MFIANTYNARTAYFHRNDLSFRIFIFPWKLINISILAKVTKLFQVCEADLMKKGVWRWGLEGEF